MVDSSPLGSRVSLAVAGALRTLGAPEIFSCLQRDISLRPRVDCKTVGFFLKIRKEIGKAWRKIMYELTFEGENAL